MPRGTECTGRVPSLKESVVRVQGKGVDGVERPAVAEHEECVRRNRAREILSCSTGAFAGGRPTGASFQDRFGHGTGKEKALTVWAPLRALSSVGDVRKLVGSPATEGDNEDLGGSVHRLDIGEMSAIRVPGRLRSGCAVSSEQTGTSIAGRPRDV